MRQEDTMKLIPSPLKGAYLIEIEKFEDSRGFFSRMFCKETFDSHGLESNFVQMNNSYNVRKGTLRGMHYQLAPYQEVKLVRCVHGSLYDVILDIRPDSPSLGKWFGAELSKENRSMMYVPKGFAHGFVTLEPDTEVIYAVTEVYCKENERGIRWDDPEFQIKWPLSPTTISEKDANHRNFTFQTHLNLQPL